MKPVVCKSWKEFVLAGEGAIFSVDDWVLVKCPGCGTAESLSREHWVLEAAEVAPTLTPEFSHLCGFRGKLESGVWVAVANTVY